MNIYDVYITSIYTVVDRKCSNISDIDYKAIYSRDAIVLKKRTYYIDLFTNEKIKSNIYDCDIGDKFVVPTIKYTQIVDCINKSDIVNPNMSRKKIFKILVKNSKRGEK